MKYSSGRSRGCTGDPAEGSAATGGSAPDSRSRCRRCCSNTGAASPASCSRPRWSTSTTATNVIVVASMGGRDENPQWYHNLVANPDMHIEIGPRAARGARRDGRPRGEGAAVAEAGRGLRRLRHLPELDRPGDPGLHPEAALAALRRAEAGIDQPGRHAGCRSGRGGRTLRPFRWRRRRGCSASARPGRCTHRRAAGSGSACSRH